MSVLLDGGSLSEKYPFSRFYPWQSTAEGRLQSKRTTFRTGWGTFHDAALNRGGVIELLAVTYPIENLDANEAIAYAWNRFSRKIPNIKRRSSHPSVKVGRLAVSKKHQGQNWGKLIISLLKEWFIHNNKTGCRFITVDVLRP